MKIITHRLRIAILFLIFSIGAIHVSHAQDARARLVALIQSGKVTEAHFDSLYKFQPDSLEAEMIRYGVLDSVDIRHMAVEAKENVYSSGVDALIQKMLRYRLIEQEDVETVNSSFNVNPEHNLSTVYTALYMVETKKIQSRMTEDTNSIAPAMAKSYESLTTMQRYLMQLDSAGFLDPELYKRMKQKISTDTIHYRFALLGALTNEHYKHNVLGTEQLLPYVNGLHEQQIINDQNYKRLTDSISKERIESIRDLYAYCNNATLIDLSKYPKEQRLYIPQVFQDVSKTMPELAYTDFKYYIARTPAMYNRDTNEYQLHVSFRCAGRTYHGISRISPYWSGKPEEGDYISYLGMLDHANFYGIFNTVLEDLHSPYRLHLSEARHEEDVNATDLNPIFGIIALRESQANYLHQESMYMVISFEPIYHNNRLKKEVEQNIAELRKSGIFSHLNEAEIASATAAALDTSIFFSNQALRYFPHVTYTLLTIFGEPLKPYEDILLSFKDISHGAFAPTDIYDDTDNRDSVNIKVKFKIAGKAYFKEYFPEEHHSTFFNKEFIDFVNQILVDNKTDGQFYEINGEDNVSHEKYSYIYLTKKQKDYLTEHELISFW